MAARIDRANNVYQLDRPAEPDELVPEEDVQEPRKLARLLGRVLRDIADVKRRWYPRQTTYHDRVATAGTPLRLAHRFNARVDWWIVDWAPSTPGDAPLFERSSSSTANILVLDVGNTGTVSVRVEVGA